MKCPVCELFGRESNFQTKRDLDQHATRFHGVTGAQLNESISREREVAAAKTVPARARRLLH